jgi:hypothetical protein
MHHQPPSCLQAPRTKVRQMIGGLEPVLERRRFAGRSIAKAFESAECHRHAWLRGDALPPVAVIMRVPKG